MRLIWLYDDGTGIREASRPEEIPGAAERIAITVDGIPDNDLVLQDIQALARSNLRDQMRIVDKAIVVRGRPRAHVPATAAHLLAYRHSATLTEVRLVREMAKVAVALTGAAEIDEWVAICKRLYADRSMVAISDDDIKSLGG